MAVEMTDKTYPIQQEWIYKITAIWGLCTGIPIWVLYFTDKSSSFFCIFLSL